MRGYSTLHLLSGFARNDGTVSNTPFMEAAKEVFKIKELDAPTVLLDIRMATETEDVPISELAAENAGATESGDPGKFLAWDIAFGSVKFSIVYSYIYLQCTCAPPYNMGAVCVKTQVVVIQ